MTSKWGNKRQPRKERTSKQYRQKTITPSFYPELNPIQSLLLCICQIQDHPPPIPPPPHPEANLSLIKSSLMHQWIPVVPISTGNSGAFTYVLIPGVGHLQFLSFPEGQEFACPWDKRRAFDILIVLVLYVEEVVFQVKRFCSTMAKPTRNKKAGRNFKTCILVF